MIVLYVLGAYLLVNFAVRVSQDTYPEIMRLVNFMVFAYLLYRFLKKPLLEMIDGKIVEVDSLLRETKSELEAAQVEHKEASELIAGVDDEAARLLARAKQMGEVERDLLIKDAKRRSENVLAQAEVTLRGREREIRQRMRIEIAGRCVDEARAKIRKMLSPDAHLALIRARIGRVGRRP